ncbi:hypothetical protein GIB67_040185 [Kingdonia uniflora]|uniref:Nop domain-containing protein n=1 Tax=Kingdonia uniflora TaxID=39325 RepID=A0A7J7MUR3_9MAGN|nr:hypothetical protein GIB67_040185 [Kingdonia uniflora]
MKIGNKTDMTHVDLQGLLSSAMIIVVLVIASTTSGEPLPEEALEKTIDACNRSIALDSAKKKVYNFLESRMVYTAPNLSAIVGSAIAAKLIGNAGGLSKFVKIPDDTVRHLGMKSAVMSIPPKKSTGFFKQHPYFRLHFILKCQAQIDLNIVSGTSLNTIAWKAVEEELNNIQDFHVLKQKELKNQCFNLYLIF